MPDKLSKDDVLQMGTYVPLMLEDLKGTKHLNRFQVKWDLLLKKGGMGHEIVDLYMKILQVLPEDKQKKYPS